MLRMTILAARRVFPPLLITPAKASKPFIKETGPEARPFDPARYSLDERRVERFDPVPDPPLNSMPSVTTRFKMECMSSCTELIKQAEHCGVGSIPTLNQTGELKAAIWLTSKWVSSASKASAS